MTGPAPAIAARLLIWQVSGVTAILLALGLFFYGELSQIVVSSVDRTLHAKAQIFTGLLHEEHGKVELELSDIIAGEYVIPRSGHYYRVIMGTALLAASPSLTDENFSFMPTNTSADSGGQAENYANAIGPAGEAVRVLHYHYRAFDTTFEITLAEKLTEGLTIVSTFRNFLLIILPLGMLILSLATWWIIRTSLTPLAQFSTTIETITHRNLDERLNTDRMARELTCVASSFNDMLDRLHQVFESQKRLVADASHELKTPLSVITTQCDVTLQKERSPLEYADAIHAIRLETENITRLVNDLLSLARLDAGLVAATGFSPVFVQDLATHAVRLTAPLAASLEIRVTAIVDETLQIRGVRSSLEEALLNVVENGIRYNHKGGEVCIIASLKENGQVAIEVTDTGIGIRSEEREKIFERFYRAASARNSDGSGLGLSIVKAIIEGHGGCVVLDSEPGHGSTFTLTLPAVARDSRVNEVL
ncbi:MAG: sensor histidine kinase [Desulfuromonadaceae bacterium]